MFRMILIFLHNKLHPITGITHDDNCITLYINIVLPVPGQPVKEALRLRKMHYSSTSNSTVEFT